MCLYLRYQQDIVVDRFKLQQWTRKRKRVSTIFSLFCCFGKMTIAFIVAWHATTMIPMHASLMEANNIWSRTTNLFTNPASHWALFKMSRKAIVKTQGSIENGSDAETPFWTCHVQSFFIRRKALSHLCVSAIWVHNGHGLERWTNNITPPISKSSYNVGE